MLAPRPLRCSALLTLAIATQLASQTTPEQLARDLRSAEPNQRKAAAVALHQAAGDLSDETQNELWQHVLGERGEFAWTRYRHQSTFAFPRNLKHIVTPICYAPRRDRLAFTVQDELLGYWSAQANAALVLFAIPKLQRERMTACMEAALRTDGEPDSVMLQRLLTRFGSPARDELARRLNSNEAPWSTSRPIAAVATALIEFGDAGWDILLRAVQESPSVMVRKTVFKVASANPHPIAMDRCAIKQLLGNPTCANEAAGVLLAAQQPERQEQVLRALANEAPNCPPAAVPRLIALLSTMPCSRENDQLAQQALFTLLLQGELVPSELVLQAASRRRVETLPPPVSERLLKLAAGTDTAGTDATAKLSFNMLAQAAATDDALLAKLLALPKQPIHKLRALLDPGWRPTIAAVELDAGFAAQVGDAAPQDRVRIARDFASLDLLEAAPGLLPLLRAHLAASDPEPALAALACIRTYPDPLKQLLPDVRAATNAGQRVRRSAWQTLILLQPEVLPAAIVAGNVAIEAQAAQDLGGRDLAAKLALQLKHDDPRIRRTAAYYLSGLKESQPELVLGLRSNDRVVKLWCLQGLENIRWRIGLSAASQRQIREQLGRELANANANWQQRNDAASGLRNLGLLRVQDAEILTALQLPPASIAEPAWQSRPPTTDVTEFYPNLTTTDLVVSLQSLPLTPITRTWLQTVRQGGGKDRLAFRRLAQAVLARDAMRKQLLPRAKQWLATDDEPSTAPPEAPQPLTKSDVQMLLPDLYAAMREAARQRGEETLPKITGPSPRAARKPSVLKVGDFEFPYVLLAKGNKPPTGWPLFICLHGGGGNGKAQGPHAWRVNSREWQAQQTLFDRVYREPGLYFIPRMADDRRGRWWHDHNQIAFEQVIRQCLLFREVDANRVYMMGISEGGYGAIRFAANRPDRFAATGGMAAAEPMNTSPPENMRNVAMRIDIGERDTMFDRVGLARRMGERLEGLRAADPEGYDHAVHVQKGRGHGIDYSLTPPWLAQRVRDPRPKRVVWTIKKFDSRVASRHYWLALDAAPESLPWFVDAKVEGNEIHLTAEQHKPGTNERVPVKSGSLRVLLDDLLVDLDREVRVIVNGRTQPPRKLVRRLPVMLQTLSQRADLHGCYCAELRINF